MPSAWLSAVKLLSVSLSVCFLLYFHVSACFSPLLAVFSSMFYAMPAAVSATSCHITCQLAEGNMAVVASVARAFNSLNKSENVTVVLTAPAKISEVFQRLKKKTKVALDKRKHSTRGNRREAGVVIQNERGRRRRMESLCRM